MFFLYKPTQGRKWRKYYEKNFSCTENKLKDKEKVKKNSTTPNTSERKKRKKLVPFLSSDHNLIAFSSPFFAHSHL
jgi:hypothetical protein